MLTSFYILYFCFLCLREFDTLTIHFGIYINIDGSLVACCLSFNIISLFFFTSCVRSSKKTKIHKTKKSEIILVTKALFWFIHKNCIRDDSNQFSFTSQSSSFIIHTECFFYIFVVFSSALRLIFPENIKK